jgi:hypothetical protein
MTRRVIVIGGFILLLGCIIFGRYVQILISSGISAALHRDRQTLYTSVGGSGCAPIKSLYVNTPSRTISENDTQAINFDIKLNDCCQDPQSQYCQELTLTISLEAPQFDLTPSSTDIVINIPISQQGQDVKYSWVLTPKRLGTFSIVVIVSQPDPFNPGQNSELGEQEMGLTVTNAFGLNIVQAQFVSYVGGALGAFFGPTLTFVWWYDRWKERKKGKKVHTANTTPGSIQRNRKSKRKRNP